MSEPVTRREFLLPAGSPGGESAAAAAGSASQAEGSPTSQPWPLTSVSRRAMACEFSVLINAREDADGIPLCISALEIATDLEEKLSAFIPSSDLCRVNQRAGQGDVEIGDELFEVLQLARQLYEMTGGAFDISAAPLWRLWGFLRREGRRPPDTEIRAALSLVGMQHVQLDEARQSVRFDRPGMEINLGAIGKGYAVDRICERLIQAGLKNFLVQAGSSSIRGVGARAGPSNDGWCINLPHPWKSHESLTRIALRDRALGTSGSSQQSFHHRGVRYGHILDPRTGMPAEGLLSATVLDDRAAHADALATSFYVLGVEGTKLVCQRNRHIGAILVFMSASGQVTKLVLNTAAE